ncbi:MAG: PEP-CTERM sorting domain-containing protein [Planctomycetota bacterium]
MKTLCITTTAATLGLAPLAAAQPFYRVTGDLFDNNPAQVGTFVIDIDPNGLNDLVTNADLGPSEQLEIEPWYGYDVLSATVTIDGFTWTTADVVLSLLPFGGPQQAQFWIEGAPIDQLDTEDFGLNLVDTDNSLASVLIGNPTGDLTQVLTSEVAWNSPISFGSLGDYQNVTVTLVPEPTSLALLGLGGLLVARRRHSSTRFFFTHE